MGVFTILLVRSIRKKSTITPIDFLAKKCNQTKHKQPKKQIVILDFWVIKFVFNRYRLMIYAILSPS